MLATKPAAATRGPKHAVKNASFLALSTFVPGQAGRSSRRPLPAVLRRSCPLAERDAFTAYLAPLRQANGSSTGTRPFGWSEAVQAYLSRYTHRVAISNSRLIGLDDAKASTFKWKDYRAKGRERAQA